MFGKQNIEKNKKEFTNKVKCAIEIEKSEIEKKIKELKYYLREPNFEQAKLNEIVFEIESLMKDIENKSKAINIINGL